MSGKKKSATKKTQQEIREMIACLEESVGLIDEIMNTGFIARSMYDEAGILTARINKLIGKPN